MKQKWIGTVLLFLILVLVWLIASQRFSSTASEDPYINLNIDGVQCVVAGFKIQPDWVFSTRGNGHPGNIERWQELVLVSQSDALKFFDNREAGGMYGRVNMTDPMVEKQRSYVMDRFREQSDDLKVSRVCIVLEPSGQVAHLLVPIHGPQGQYFTSLEWINGNWYVVPGIGEASWALLNARKILETLESQGCKEFPTEQIGPVMRKLSAAYLNR